jgi:hypothetical protein
MLLLCLPFSVSGRFRLKRYKGDGSFPQVLHEGSLRKSSIPCLVIMQRDCYGRLALEVRMHCPTQARIDV